MSRTFTPCAEAESLYRQTLERACSREFLGWTTSSRQEAIDQINNAFWAAAGANETAAGEHAPDQRRMLDVSEARLAIVALNHAAGGDFLVAANEGRAAYRRLQETIGTLRGWRSSGRSPAEFLMDHCASRGRGWRRIRDETVQRDIRANFRNDSVTALDSRPGMDPVDAVFAAYVYNSQAGGLDEDISFNDAMFASSAIENALRGLTEYYS